MYCPVTQHIFSRKLGKIEYCFAKMRFDFVQVKRLGPTGKVDPPTAPRLGAGCLERAAGPQGRLGAVPHPE